MGVNIIGYILGSLMYWLWVWGFTGIGYQNDVWGAIWICPLVGILVYIALNVYIIRKIKSKDGEDCSH